MTAHYTPMYVMCTRTSTFCGFNKHELPANDAKVCPVNRPKADPIFVSLDRVRHCPEEIPSEESWPHRSNQQKTRENDFSVLTNLVVFNDYDATAAEPENISPWEGDSREIHENF